VSSLLATILRASETKRAAGASDPAAVHRIEIREPHPPNLYIDVVRGSSTSSPAMSSAHGLKPMVMFAFTKHTRMYGTWLCACTTVTRRRFLAQKERVFLSPARSGPPSGRAVDQPQDWAKAQTTCV